MNSRAVGLVGSGATIHFLGPKALLHMSLGADRKPRLLAGMTLGLWPFRLVRNEGTQRPGLLPAGETSKNIPTDKNLFDDEIGITWFR